MWRKSRTEPRMNARGRAENEHIMNQTLFILRKAVALRPLMSFFRRVLNDRLDIALYLVSLGLIVCTVNLFKCDGNPTI